MTIKELQAEFFDRHPVLYPWPRLLVERGMGRVFKPRDLKFKNYLEHLGMKPGEAVLEVGCGRGVFLSRLVKTYQVKAVGIDISTESIKAAQEWLKRLKPARPASLSFKVGDALKLPFEDNRFDYLVSFDTLEHIKAQDRAAREMVRVLKPGGKILVYTINSRQTYTWRHSWNLLLAKLGVDVCQKSAHDPKLFLEPDWLKGRLEVLGVKVEKLELFNAFFTLAVDELIMLGVWLFDRLGLFYSESFFKKSLGRLVLRLLDIFSRLTLRPLDWLDQPWKKQGWSNSFFILGTKGES